MADIFGEQSSTYEERRAVLVQQGTRMRTVVLDSGNVDSGATPTTRLREGNVLVKRTSTGKYIEANDTNGDRNLPPIVTASETADDDWESGDISVYKNGAFLVTVSMGANDDTDTEVAAALNADATFRAHAIASVANSRVVITGIEAGGEQSLKVVHDDNAAAFGSSGTEEEGSWADYGVLARPADQTDENGSASDTQAPIVYAKGRFRESQLINLTADARQALIARGCVFES